MAKKKKKKDITEWRKEGKHLPRFMRDFHAQKDLFKAIHLTYRSDNPEEIINKINWVDGQIYAIDIFLWFMAAHGYTLQKHRGYNVDFFNINASIEEANKIRSEHFTSELKRTLAEMRKE